jgi:hypothetical protein
MSAAAHAGPPDALPAQARRSQPGGSRLFTVKLYGPLKPDIFGGEGYCYQLPWDEAPQVWSWTGASKNVTTALAGAPAPVLRHPVVNACYDETSQPYGTHQNVTQLSVAGTGSGTVDGFSYAYRAFLNLGVPGSRKPPKVNESLYSYGYIRQGAR